MNRKFLAAAVFSAAMMLGSSGAMAGGGVRVGVGIGIGIPAYRPYPYYGYPYPYPYYYPYPYAYPYYPPPTAVYVQPPPGYVQPAPGYYQPAPATTQRACRCSACARLSPIFGHASTGPAFGDADIVGLSAAPPRSDAGAESVTGSGAG